MGLEGIVTKRRDCGYAPGKCRHWVKTKNPAHPAFSRSGTSSYLLGPEILAPSPKVAAPAAARERLAPASAGQALTSSNDGSLSRIGTRLMIGSLLDFGSPLWLARSSALKRRSWRNRHQMTVMINAANSTKLIQPHRLPPHCASISRNHIPPIVRSLALGWWHAR